MCKYQFCMISLRSLYNTRRQFFKARSISCESWKKKNWDLCIIPHINDTASVKKKKNYSICFSSDGMVWRSPTQFSLRQTFESFHINRRTHFYHKHWLGKIKRSVADQSLMPETMHFTRQSSTVKYSTVLPMFIVYEAKKSHISPFTSTSHHLKCKKCPLLWPLKLLMSVVFKLENNERWTMMHQHTKHSFNIV